MSIDWDEFEDGGAVSDAVLEVVNASIEKQKADLGRALNRKRRAIDALNKADRDIDTITGALMALEDIKRRFTAGVQAAAPSTPALEKEPPKYITLAGEVHDG